jgi:hypothetical protein
MMHRKIGRDVKLAAINLYEHWHLPLEDILACVVGFSPAMHLSFHFNIANCLVVYRIGRAGFSHQYLERKKNKQ